MEFASQSFDALQADVTVILEQEINANSKLKGWSLSFDATHTVLMYSTVSRRYGSLKSANTVTPRE